MAWAPALSHLHACSMALYAPSMSRLSESGCRNSVNHDAVGSEHLAPNTLSWGVLLTHALAMLWPSTYVALWRRHSYEDAWLSQVLYKVRGRLARHRAPPPPPPSPTSTPLAVFDTNGCFELYGSPQTRLRWGTNNSTEP